MLWGLMICVGIRFLSTVLFSGRNCYKKAYCMYEDPHLQYDKQFDAVSLLLFFRFGIFFCICGPKLIDFDKFQLSFFTVKSFLFIFLCEIVNLITS